MDGIKDNINEFTRDVRRCVDLRIDSMKLQMIEAASKILGTVLTFVLLALPVFFAVAFMFVAITLLLVPLVGVVWSLFIMVALLVLLSFILYRLCRPYFTGVVLRVLCQMLFKKETELNNESENEE